MAADALMAKTANTRKAEHESVANLEMLVRIG